MRRVFVSLFNYSISPVYIETNERLRIWPAIKVWLSLFVAFAFFSLVAAALIVALGILPDNHAKFALQFTPFVNFCIITFLGPLLEEAAFRLPLRAGKYHLFVASSVLTYIVTTNFFFHTKNYDLGHDFPLRLAISLGIGGLVFQWVRKRELLLVDFWKRHFRVVYYGTVLFFAYMHLLNFKIADLPWYALPLATLPQLFTAFIFGYARMRYGFWFAVLLHCGFNGIPELLSAALLRFSHQFV